MTFQNVPSQTPGSPQTIAPSQDNTIKGGHGDPQKDLTALEKWETDWQMQFHPQKCTVNSVTAKRTHISTDYKLHGHTLQTEKDSKYLGVTISSNLKWDNHIGNITNKANRTLGFLRRNMRGCNTMIRAKAYTTMVRPTLEYASTVWDPHTLASTYKIEKIQRRAARFAKKDYSSRDQGCVTNMIQS